ncbi:hypothetical protein Zmor_011462 [Zophobas morio]|uniref:TIL domain-containing protein n=1 Tax=Zophobas morio TaxID=2755281 RepID=A0AA38IR63_9CUCU|nr:hypothetical protein Zmor_011462 [Zophobas morio]
MFSFIISTLLLLGATSGLRFPICAENEEYLDCGTECPQTCLEIFEPRQCSDVCVEGCFCKEGFVRAGESGPCVPRASCKNVPQCAANEIYTKCAPLCPPTCEEKEPKPCLDKCLDGCVCKEGYIRSVTGGACVPEDTCDIDVCTKSNQVYKDCGTPCPGTCEQPLRVCERRCVPGCFCQEGYVLDPETQECIRLQNCPNRFF